MHLVCLGHDNHLIKRWLRLLQPLQITAIDELLSNLRLPHNVSDASEWHAEHFRLFILNVGLPCVLNYLPILQRSHFAVYALAVKFLHCPYSCDEIDLSNSLMKYYYQAAPRVFDESIELVSLHCHLHLPEQVKRHSLLTFPTVFCLESCIRYIKKDGTWYSIIGIKDRIRVQYENYNTSSEMPNSIS